MSESDVNKFIEENRWMIRPCHMYQEEYSDCTSIKARLHQYFVFGEQRDCTQWKTDLNNCLQWENKKKTDACVELLNSEEQRRKERLDAHYGNNVWEKRTEPPSDWSKPLPEWMQKEHEVSYLGLKAKEFVGGDVKTDMFANRTFCVIM